ncbi:MAG: DUF4294 domain-containing protein, partial [Bacteroidia bacterium]
LTLYSQNNIHDLTIAPAHGFRCRAEIVNGDTIPVIDLYAVEVETNMVFKTHKQYVQWARIKRDVKITYPYAIIAAAKLKEYDRVLARMPNDKLKKAYLRVCEKDLRKEFEGTLKDLTIEQGRVLMKLIDRESGKTAYDIVKEMRGTFQAVMWQTLATLFGNTMKHEYDATSSDVMIEQAVKLVEAGNF